MNDKANAKDALDLPIYQHYSEDNFFSDTNNSWIGSLAGDESASYEFRDTNQ